MQLIDTKWQVFTPETGSGSGQNLELEPEAIDMALNCSMGELTKTCPAIHKVSVSSASSSCPDYFHWINEDLSPWRETGITRKMVMSARPTANFRLVVVDGSAYVERYGSPYQSRGTFTLWGIAQMLRRYPGKLPDLDLMFDCNTFPVITKDMLCDPKRPSAPPPLFGYCGNDSTLDIMFPDWSFWGWPEINIKPWEVLSKELKEGNTRTQWSDREPYAYWKGNPTVAATRMDLLKCNVSEKQDWNARIFTQDWSLEKEKGYKESDLASQCIHRFKIYIEGVAWSASQKYIMACDSVTLFVKPVFYEFFTRSLMPLKHYWPVKEEDKCRSIKHAVEWGTTHREEARAIGRAASSFVLEDLKMDYVYDYMFHLLNEYGKLMTYKPAVPAKASPLCSEVLACPAKGIEKKFMLDSLVGPASTEPCTMPAPYDPVSRHSVVQAKEDGIKQVDTWETEYYNKQI